MSRCGHFKDCDKDTRTKHCSGWLWMTGRDGATNILWNWGMAFKRIDNAGGDGVWRVTLRWTNRVPQGCNFLYTRCDLHIECAQAIEKMWYHLLIFPSYWIVRCCVVSPLCFLAHKYWLCDLSPTRKRICMAKSNMIKVEVTLESRRHTYDISTPDIDKVKYAVHQDRLTAWSAMRLQARVEVVFGALPILLLVCKTMITLNCRPLRQRSTRWPQNHIYPPVHSASCA